MTPSRHCVFAVPDYFPSTGGTTRQTHNQAQALLAKGYSVTVLTQRLDRNWAASETLNGIRVVRFGPASRNGWAMKAFVASVGWWLLRHRSRIDALTAIMYPDFAVSALLGGVSNKTVMVWAGYGDATDTLGPQSLVKRPWVLLRRVALRRGRSVALSHKIADELAGCAPELAQTIIPTPINLGDFPQRTEQQKATAREDLAIDGATVLFVYCGHLRRLKRVDTLLDALALLITTHANVATRLLIVGGSREDLEDQTDALGQQAVTLGIQDRVTFVGNVGDVRPYLHAADGFVLPSDREGISNSLLEALACGVPCIAPISAGGAEVLNQECGIVTETNAPADLCAAMVTLCDPAERLRLSLGTAQTIAQYEISVVTEKYIALYNAF